MSTPAVIAVLAFVLAMLVIAITRRGKNLLSAVAPLAGETLLRERDIEFSSLAKRSAHFTTPYFTRGRLRITNERLILTQPALGTGTAVVRYIVHLRPGATDPTRWADGVTTFVLAGSEVDEHGDLRLMPASDAAYLPKYVVLRGQAVADVLGAPRAAE